MTLIDLLNAIPKSDRVRIEEIDDNEIKVSVNNGSCYMRVLRIYSHGKSAEFLDIDDKWDELDGALEDDIFYRKFPELLKIKRVLNSLDYHIMF